MVTTIIDEDVPLLHEPLSLADLEGLERRLRALDDDLRRTRESAEEQELETSGGARFQEDDEATEDSALEAEIGALAAEEELGEAVHDALARLRDGTYGTCDACGDWISHERLLIVPYARTCRACAART